MGTVYRIYTEDLNRGEVIRLTGKRFESFTLHPTTGYYRGRAEKSIVLEIVEAQRKEVSALANDIRRLNGQKSVLIMSLTGKVKRMTT
jgi:hypothetical protein